MRREKGRTDWGKKGREERERTHARTQPSDNTLAHRNSAYHTCHAERTDGDGRQSGPANDIAIRQAGMAGGSVDG